MTAFMLVLSFFSVFDLLRVLLLQMWSLEPEPFKTKIFRYSILYESKLSEGKTTTETFFRNPSKQTLFLSAVLACLAILVHLGRCLLRIARHILYTDAPELFRF